MRKIVLTLLIFAIIFPLQVSAKSEVKCPDSKQLEVTSPKEKDELIKALEKIVPNTYGESDYGNYFSQWEVVNVLPLAKTTGKDNYFEKAKQVCGEKVAQNSWLVTLHFPLWEGKSESATKGQIFLAENKDDGWFVWYRYH